MSKYICNIKDSCTNPSRDICPHVKEHEHEYCCDTVHKTGSCAGAKCKIVDTKWDQ